ncbi:MAG: DUF4159 domain-containing protein [Candidatus Cloacimonetes bacterium]|nr:DUF4159 domain-containing protein [Candidatus Cloacimonadota bacterium]
MKKIKMILIMLLGMLISIASLNAAQLNKEQIARLHFDGGGDWYNNPDMIPNMVQVLNRELHTDFASEEAVVTPGESRLFDFPFVIMTGHGNISFSENDARNLRSWLLRGGTLYADDDYGMDESFRREIAKVFPEKEMVELPAEHEIFHCFYELNGTPKIHKHDDKRPQTFAIYDESGRIMVLYTYETNISDGWSNAHDDPPNIRQKAFQMGTNILYYIFTKG